MNLRHLSITLPLVITIATGGWWYLGYADRHPATSNAYIGRHVVRIAPQISGLVQQTAIQTNQAVKSGDLLFSIDPAPFELAVERAAAQFQQAQDNLAAATAQVAVAQAQLAIAETNAQEAIRHADRLKVLVAKGSASQDDGDNAEQQRITTQNALISASATLNVAIATRGAPGADNAAIKSAQTALDQARLDLAHTRITAPADGIIGEFDLRPGSFVSASSPLFALVEHDPVWVDANFKETDLPRIQPGQSATVTVDLLPGRTFRGEVEGLSPASGAAFSLLPPENATGNWVKITQRFAVRIRLLDPLPELRVGASAEVRIDTTAR